MKTLNHRETMTAATPPESRPWAARAGAPELPRLKTILVPYDLSDDSTWALKYACQLVEKFDGAVIITWGVTGHVPGLTPDTLREQISLSTGLAPNRILGVVMRPGRLTPRQIAEHCRHEGVDLIVVADTYRLQPAPFYRHRPLETLTRQAPCPVLIVNRPAGASTPFVTQPNRSSSTPASL